MPPATRELAAGPCKGAEVPLRGVGKGGPPSAGQALGDWQLTGCTLVVTLEPCTMCAGAVVLARLSTLVFGAYDPKAGAAGSLWDVVRDRRLNHRPQVIGGVLEAETADVLRAFFATRR